MAASKTPEPRGRGPREEEVRRREAERRIAYSDRAMRSEADREDSRPVLRRPFHQTK
ncbi:hypothetical protein MTDSW087_05694 [Methylobacterium dankookense]|uniref:Uncharacterized protein n=1 Tax=Methylobacterium dankookense TaxID=560405 RepID=A0A564G5V8_9HYPH|nr:hypothetical protein IFDJLNFL_5543 [Methylobacterium dankookense]VUF15945.1 hypothetical protein MTDSW087_05694 [Methylobacterium dankookense]